MVLRMTFEAAGGGTAVHIESQNKVRFGLCNHRAALVHVERSVRQRAKTAGLDELIAGVNQ